MMKKYSIRIQWGSVSSHGEDNKPIKYEFDTEAELNAFMMGVDAMDGWMEYFVVEDCPYCGGNCPNEPEDSEFLCDGYAGDIDDLCK
jgi:hypothetical protein